MYKKHLTLLALSLLVFTACKTTSTQKVSTVDKQIYEDAVNSMSAELCGTISSANYSFDCVLVIQSNKLSDEAVAKNDLAKCNQIQHDQIKKSCTVKVETNIKASQKMKKLQEESPKITGEAVSEKDYKLCEKIEDINIRGECMYHVLSSPAFESETSEICKVIENEFFRDLCVEQKS